jgi:hypothetical protein
VARHVGSSSTLGASACRSSNATARRSWGGDWLRLLGAREQELRARVSGQHRLGLGAEPQVGLIAGQNRGTARGCSMPAVRGDGARRHGSEPRRDKDGVEA